MCSSSRTIELVNQIIKSAENSGVEVTICGEIASNPVIAGTLIGLGARKLSMNPDKIQPVANFLCSHSINYFDDIAREAIAGKNFLDILYLISESE